MAEVDFTPSGPIWAERLLIVCRRLGQRLSNEERAALRTDAWLLLNAALTHYSRVHARILGRVSREEIEDLASTKSLDLLRASELGRWSVDRRSAPELASYLSTVAKNGLIDRLRARGRVTPLDGITETGPDGVHARESTIRGDIAGADQQHERSRFAAALRACVERLASRARIAWYLRVFHDFSSRQIAEHPAVAINSAHVDVVLQRARGTVRSCMHEQGHDVSDLPPGCFVEIWDAFHPHPTRKYLESDDD